MGNQDVVVYRVTEGGDLDSYERNTITVASAFVDSPKWPAKQGDHFIAVNDGGHGSVVAACDPSLVGLSFAEARRSVAQGIAA